MASKEKDTERIGFKAVIGIATLTGLIGGLLFGVWDSITVIIGDAPRPVPFSDIFFLALYSASIYALIGCLGMAAVGIASSGVLSIGRYRVNKSRLAGIFIGVFVLFAVFLLLAYNAMFGPIIGIVEIMVICLLSGVGFAGLIVYVLDKRVSNEKLIAAFICLLVSLLVLVYAGLWANVSLLSEEAFFKPMSLLTNVALLVLVSLLAVGLYILSLSILSRYNPQRIRQAGYILLGVMVCAFITISFIGPFSFERTPEAGASAARENGTLVNSDGLKGKPNILWIVMDTVRADHLSCYGYHRNTTPNIDRIAGEGILFENAISAAPWTLPSHASMFTGMFPSKHGTDTEHLWLEGNFQSIAEVLRAHGYSTFGYSNNPYVSHRNNLSQGFDSFEMTPYGKVPENSELADLLKVNIVKPEVQNILLMDDGASRTNEVVKRWIADAHQAETPFFVFINYMEAHRPYHPPEAYAMPYLGKDVSFAKAMSVNQIPSDYITGQVEMSDGDFDILCALYDGEISYLDFRMGQLFDYLRELEILDDTVLIITSDHGENFGEHHLMGHLLCIYDTLLHVPLVIRYPAFFEAGLRIGEQAQLTDIFPTILDIVAIDRDSEAIQGYSLLKGREGGESFAIAEYAIGYLWFDKLKNANPEFDISIYARRLKTVRTEEFKYIWASDGRDELYNIQRDPGELNNLIETYDEKSQELKALLKEWLNSFELYRPEAAQQVP